MPRSADLHAGGPVSQHPEAGGQGGRHHGRQHRHRQDHRGGPQQARRQGHHALQESREGRACRRGHQVLILDIHVVFDI